MSTRTDNMSAPDSYYKDFITNLPNPIFWIDTNLCYLDCNKSYLRTLGISSRDELIGKPLSAFFPEADYEKFVFLCNKVLKSQNESVYENRIVIQPLLSNDKCVGLAISEYKTIEQKARAIKNTDKSLLKSLMKNLPAAVYWMDKDCVIQGDSLIHAKMCGFQSSEEVIGKTDYDFPWKEQADEIIANDREVMRTRQAQTFEEVAMLMDGKKHIFLTKKTPLVNDHNEVIGLLGISVDITENKEFEERIHQANASKARLIFSIGHLIRGPLTSILGTAQVLQQSKLANKQERAVTIIENSVKKIPPILERIQFYIDLENGEEKSADADIELKSFFEHHWNQHIESIKAKSLQGHFDYDEQLPKSVNVGSYFLSLILDNLLSNAVKYTLVGDVFFKVSKLAQEGDNVMIKIEVMDTGIGIRVQAQAELFSLLKPSELRDDIAFTDPGLKLSITAKMVELLGGTIKVNSALNKGTTFTIEIPVRIIEKPVSAYTSDYAHFYSQSQTARLQRPLDSLINVLVIEDDISAQRVMKMMLEEEYNCRIDSAYNLATAKDLINNPYDIIFVDMNLPDGSGLDFVKLVVSRQKEHPPIVAVTAYASEEEKIKMVENGVIDIIVKPVDLAILKLVVNSYVFEEPPTDED